MTILRVLSNGCMVRFKRRRHQPRHRRRREELPQGCTLLGGKSSTCIKAQEIRSGYKSIFAIEVAGADRFRHR